MIYTYIYSYWGWFPDPRISSNHGHDRRGQTEYNGCSFRMNRHLGVDEIRIEMKLKYFQNELTLILKHWNLKLWNIPLRRLIVGPLFSRNFDGQKQLEVRDSSPNSVWYFDFRSLWIVNMEDGFVVLTYKSVHVYYHYEAMDTIIFCACE